MPNEKKTYPFISAADAGGYCFTELKAMLRLVDQYSVADGPNGSEKKSMDAKRSLEAKADEVRETLKVNGWL